MTTTHICLGAKGSCMALSQKRQHLVANVTLVLFVIR